MVAFSGGRDSSALLAVAVSMARRDGLPLPIPITLRYPDAEGADESAWQEMVLRHLGLSERVVLTVGREHDPLGPVATPLLRRHGLVWPPNFTPSWRLLDQARGGVLLTGESGDEVFGSKRITPLTTILTSHGKVRPRVYRAAVRAVAPTALRRRNAFRNRYVRPWLRKPVEELLGARAAEDAVAFSMHAGRAAWQFVIRRAICRGHETLETLGREIGAEFAAPFAEPDFVAAVAHVGGFWGSGGRTPTMLRLFSDVLPRELLERSTKAYFNRALFTEHSRSFARNWDGSGVDADLVDPEALRENWLSDLPHSPTMCLLQQAWLHNNPPNEGHSPPVRSDQQVLR
jgi:asparagine synthase (glutamine-hydrolysing)